METAPLKNFATWARKELIREVTARIAAVLAPGSSERVEQAKAVTALEKAVTAAGGGDKGRAAVADKVAYTWFNRIIALRFMDAKGYTGIGVVSPPAGVEVGQPEVLAEAKRGVIDAEVVRGKSVKMVAALLDGTRASADPQGEAYARLLEAYCNHWHQAMPFMFEREGDFTELLVPANLLADDSVLNRSVTVLTEEVCQDVEVIGWLYQFYISEVKQDVYEGFRHTKAGAHEIPPATQIFTPRWIVRALVENSLGRLWMLNNPNSALIHRMDYYIPPDVEQAGFLRISRPEDLRVIDPACGSGHLLTYAFDLLYAIYEEEGYAPSVIASTILQHNLYGAEIDPRAGALAAFALTMKARARQRRFFAELEEPHICVIEEVHLTDQERADLREAGMDDLFDQDSWGDFASASLLGSLTRPSAVVSDNLVDRIEVLLDEGDLRLQAIADRVRRQVRQAQFLQRSYHVVVANPPYLGTRHMGAELRKLALKQYPVTKGDLCTMFLERSLELLMPGGFAALVTSESWFFNSTFESTRALILREAQIRVAVCIDSAAFGVVLNTVAAVLEKGGAPAPALFTRVNRAAVRAGIAELPVPNAPAYTAEQTAFDRVPGRVLAFDMPEALLRLYEAGGVLGDRFLTRQGMATTDNARFVRFWWEVSAAEIERGHSASSRSNPGWVPYNKGGTPTRWWGNQLHVVRWKDSAAEMRAAGAKSVSEPNFFRTSVSWSNIGSGGAQFRLYPEGYVFDVAGMSVFADEEDTRLNLLGYLNSRVVRDGLDVLAPTLNYQVGDVARLPVPSIESGADADRVRELVGVSRRVWADHETSHEFAVNPLVSRGPGLLADIVEDYRRWREEQALLIAKLEGASDAYWRDVIEAATGTGVAVNAEQDILAVPDANELMRDLVSYAVGCMFGRYSLDAPGLILAEQSATLPAYLARIPNPSFGPVGDNVVPVVDGDWFDDDIVERFRQFLRTALGEDSFEENLRFVTQELGAKSMRAYFVKSFYKDHVQRYRKRPIYWLVSSPRGSFGALVYGHRYAPSTVSTVLNDYLREFQAKLSASVDHAERTNNTKESERLRRDLLELADYERDVLYPLAAASPALDLDDGVRANYVRLGAAMAKIAGVGGGS